MTESAPVVRYRTGVLWVLLAVLLVFGTVAAATFVYGLTDLYATRRLWPDLVVIAGGGFGATFFLLLITGILYRVDRVRGVPHRRIELFD